MSEPRWCIDSRDYTAGSIVVAGWAFHPSGKITSAQGRLNDAPPVSIAGYGLPSADVETIYGKAAAFCRFRFVLPSAQATASLELVFSLKDGTRFSIDDTFLDPAGAVVRKFLSMLHDVSYGRVVELGARARSGVCRRDLFPSSWDYIGVDVLPGPNVDTVGDAHELSRFCKPASVDAICSFSTFEHFAMPWKVAIEINRVLKVDGLTMHLSHQTWPVHEEPWDFFRFSDQAWRSMFNVATGFEVVEAAMGDAAAVHPKGGTGQPGMENSPAFLSSAMIARKIGETSLTWDVPLDSVTRRYYPE